MRSKCFTYIFLVSGSLLLLQFGYLYWTGQKPPSMIHVTRDSDYGRVRFYPKRGDSRSERKNSVRTRTDNEAVVANAIKVPLIYTEKNLSDIVAQSLAGKRRGCPKVPKIIHQTWIDGNIPEVMSEYVRSWSAVHPDWEYWFWTDALADRFVAKRFPKFHDLFRRYPQGLMRADAIRYFILYEFGGLYADMDMKALRRFDELGRIHAALIPEDHSAHRFLIWNREHIALNALMLSVPSHPFFKLVLEKLIRVNAHTWSWDVLSKTGPFMLDKVLITYVNNSNSSWPICDSVYRPQHYRYLPVYDPSLSKSFAVDCRAILSRFKDGRKVDTCRELQRFNFSVTDARLFESAYSTHAFYHVHVKTAELNRNGHVPIQKLVPAAAMRNISQIIDSLDGEDLTIIPQPAHDPVPTHVYVVVGTVVGTIVAIPFMFIFCVICLDCDKDESEKRRKKSCSCQHGQHKWRVNAV